MERQLEALGRELAVVGAQQHLPLDRREAGHDLVVDDPHHRLRRDAVGGQRAHERARARADVDVEVVDGPVDRQQVERPQGADLVHGAGESAPAEDQRGLRAAPAATRGGLELDHVAHRRQESIRPAPRLRHVTRVRMPVFRIAVLACALLCAAVAPAAQAAGGAQTKRILRSEMAKAGASSGAHVVDLTTGRTLYAEDATVPRIPASVEKLYTTAAALQSFGPQGTIPTDVLGAAAVDPATGVLTGNLYLRGNGDPSFNAKGAGLLADILIERTGAHRDRRARGRRRDGLRRPARTALGGLPHLLLRRAAERADLQPRLHRQAPAAVPGQPAAVRGQGLHGRAAPARRDGAPQRARRRHARPARSRWPGSARPGSRASWPR